MVRALLSDPLKWLIIFSSGRYMWKSSPEPVATKTSSPSCWTSESFCFPHAESPAWFLFWRRWELISGWVRQSHSNKTRTIFGLWDGISSKASPLVARGRDGRIYWYRFLGQRGHRLQGTQSQSLFGKDHARLFQSEQIWKLPSSAQLIWLSTSEQCGARSRPLLPSDVSSKWPFSVWTDPKKLGIEGLFSFLNLSFLYIIRYIETSL